MSHEFYYTAPEEHIKKERQKARVLRSSPWWKRKREKGTCHFCGGTFKPAELTMEHIVPLARGGKSVKENLVPACKECNTKKKYLLPIEWDEYLKSIRSGKPED
ncbi:MAG: HNH endonuclease [Nitrospiraceae bacterium]|nr:HNH endonuclease [Nitrospiraceae bacterium]